MTAPIAKISPPRLSEVLSRERLFKLLDRASKRPMIWIAAPPGAGKTTLVASWLDARRLPTLWYRLDAGDGDLATFFYYLGQAAKRAAPRFRKPLPLFTPEYQFGISVFSKRYFENLVSRIKPPSVIVFDNYQEVPPDSPLHGALCDGLEALPPGVTAVFLSREAPVASMARQKAGARMSVLGWGDLRLTLDESKGLAGLQGRHDHSPALLRHCHDTVDGWAAGLVLMLAGAGTGSGDTPPRPESPLQDIFDYFAGELFEKADGDMREFLLATAFLPSMTASMAERLSGVAASGRILAYLCRNHYFTEMHARETPVYQYHPLFRAFLLSRAGESFAPGELNRVRRRAAALLEEEGQVEDAAALLVEAGDWQGFVELVLGRAQVLMAQGRHQTLQEWIEAVPRGITEDTPWLLFWLGVSLMSCDLRGSRLHIERAYGRFWERGDTAGLYLSWAAVVETYVYEWSDFHPLDRWIAEAEVMLREHPGFPTPEIEARVVSGLFCCLMYRQPHHPDLPRWEGRVRAIIDSVGEMHLKLQISSHLAFYYTWWSGEQSKAAMLMNNLRPVVSTAGVAPLPRIVWRAIEAACSWMTGDNGACLAAVEDGLALAKESGVHLWDFMLLAQASFGTLTAGDLDAARDCHQRMAFILQTDRKLDIAHYHYHLGWEAMCRRDFPPALEHMATGLRIAELAGEPFIAAFIRMGVAEALIELGDCEKAKEHLELTRGIGSAMKSNTVRYQYLWLEAMRCFASGDERAGLESLAGHLAVSREYGILNHAAWRASVMAPLYARALEAGMEVEQVQRIIRTRNLVPEFPLEGGWGGKPWSERWPWPLRIDTLGRFELLKDGEPVVFGGKVQQKPLLMLKALIALGGRDVPEERITDLLWPEVDGDQAHKSFEVNLLRLRRLLGSDGFIRLREGRLSLDKRSCLVDVRVLEELFGRAEAALRQGPAAAPEAERLTTGIFGLYRGHFLAGEGEHPWALSLRERLRSRFLHFVERGGRYWEELGRPEQAVDCYLKGLEIDDLAEEFHQGLMACYGKLGRPAKARDAYNRCRTVLKAGLGVNPSPETEALYHALCKDR